MSADEGFCRGEGAAMTDSNAHQKLMIVMMK